MKWIKHDTDLSESEKIESLISEYGFEGYGRYWRIMEMVAKNMDESDRFHAEFPESYLCSKLKVRRTVLKRFLERAAKVFGLFAVCYENERRRGKPLIRIEIPMLLKKRDNYSRNLQVTNKKQAP